MALSVLGRMQLGKKLVQQMTERETAPVMKRITLGKEIIRTMDLLGYGVAEPSETEAAPPHPEPAEVQPTPATTEPQPEPVPDIDPTPAIGTNAEEVKPSEDVPPIVVKYLAGEYTNADSGVFADALRSIEPYLGKFITFDQVKSKAAEWSEANKLTA